MSVGFEQLQAMFLQQQAQFQKAQARLIGTWSKNLSLQAGTVTVPNESGPPPEALTQQVSEFCYDADAGITFEFWFHKYEDLFRFDLAGVSEDKSVRLMLRKLGAAEHEKFTNFILPKKSTDLAFDAAVAILSQIFGEQSSLFNIRYRCLAMTKRDDEDWVSY